MVEIKTLLPELRKLVGELAEDLLARSTSDATIDSGLRDAFHQIEKGGRTAQAFEVWREDYLDQVAVAWVLACVFVRFMEDNALIDDCWLAGQGERRRLAEDTHELYFRQHPHDTDREYFQHVFKEVGQIPAAKDLFAEGKTPLWAVAPSGDAAMNLLKFWREMDAESGHLKRSFQVESGDTRFLGDLYQELSERAKKKFALLQTPVFVEEFILDRTLTPAIDEFGLEKVRMIDPTCGSGHFLLGGFARLFDLWIQRESNEIKAAQRALDGVWGVDLNPFAVAIARFRLIVAAVQACGIKRLKQAPGWNIHLASGDSLLYKQGAAEYERDLFGDNPLYGFEDPAAVKEILRQKYHVVVGNPPYITVKDKAQNEAYRQLYSTCHRQYSLGVPFTQRFWELAESGSGFIGMITANSFMKREFGKKLIEEFFPRIDLTHVIDTSGAYIPGHGTPTVILFGKNRKPVVESVRAVLGIKGEPSTPDDPSRGLVWQSIVQHIGRANAQDDFTSTADVPRETFAKHPWSIGGGGAGDLKETIESAGAATLGDVIQDIGRSTHTGEDEVFYIEPAACRTKHLAQWAAPLIEGEGVRDYSIAWSLNALMPYDLVTALPVEIANNALASHFWRYRTSLKHRMDFGQYIEERGLRWFDHSMFFPARYRTPLSIAFAFVATHNHFVLDRGGKVFKQSAPIIKLPADATEDDHLALLGLLNSSTACFWMKQVMSCKGLGGQGGGIKPEHWSRQYEYAGTQMERFPVSAEYRKLIPLAKQLDSLSQLAVTFSPSEIVQKGADRLGERLTHGRQQSESIRRQMVYLQEELDWLVYSLYGLVDCVHLDHSQAQELHPEARPVETLLKERMRNGEKSIFYDVHEYRGTGPNTGEPSDALKAIISERFRLINTNAEIRMLEQLDFKRRWQTEPWEAQEQRALKIWLLDRLETPKYHMGTKAHPELTTTAQMADVASADAEFQQVAALYRGRPDFDMAALVAELVEAEAVPLLPILRYKPTGLRKREVWERTWDLQRQQDAGKDVGDIPVPPKYATADFLKTDYWRLRGKLDVPKERWVSYPHCSTESDPTLVVGWAGWNHLEQATALIAWYDACKREGWDAKRLTPLLACLDQLLPWIHQWHPEIDAEFGETAGQSFHTMLEHDAHELGLTMDDIRNWTPPEKAKKAAKGRKKKAEAEVDE